MKAIKLSDNELNLIREHYNAELEEAEKYIVQVKEILKKLGTLGKSVINVPVEPEVKVAKKRGRKPGKKAAAKPKTAPKKRGRKPKSKATEVKPEKTAPVAVVKKQKTRPGPKPKQQVKAKAAKPVKKSVEIPASVAEKKTAPKKTAKSVAKKKKKATKGFVRPTSKPIQKKAPALEKSLETAPPVAASTDQPQAE